jgi:dsRNA-specific ribonuclease
LTANKNPQDLQNLIKYYFANQEILEKSLTRRAYLSDLQICLDENMDPLATLGDAILDAVAINRLYEKGVREKGKLTEFKNEQTKRERTMAFAEKHDLQSYVEWSKGEGQDEVWIKGPKALDTVTEALIGAVYLDAQKRGCNGMIVVREMLERMHFFDPEIEKF